MLTTYASCWGSLALRGVALVLMGAMLLIVPDRSIALATLALVLLAAAANAASTALRVRASISTWWVSLLAAAVCLLAVAALLADRHDDAGFWMVLLAGLAVLDGALLARMAWRHRHGVNPVGAVAAAAAASIGFGALLAACLPTVDGNVGTSTGLGALALTVGIASGVIALRLRRLVRLMRHELLRDAPLARQALLSGDALPDAGVAGARPTWTGRPATAVRRRAGRVPA